MKKYPFSFRLTEEAQKLLKQLADANGVTLTAIVELAIREKAERQLERNTFNKRKSSAS